VLPAPIVPPQLSFTDNDPATSISAARAFAAHAGAAGAAASLCALPHEFEHSYLSNVRAGRQPPAALCPHPQPPLRVLPPSTHRAPASP
jgi:hypothetical protein